MMQWADFINLEYALFALTLLLTLMYFASHFRKLPVATRTNNSLRMDWFAAIARTPGSEVLGVQTIRNSLMACTMTATTATLAFMGGMTLSMNSRFFAKQMTEPSLLQFLNTFSVLFLLGLAFIASMIAARNYHHAGFVAGMPVNSDERNHWQLHGQQALAKAGLFYSQSLRLMFWTVPFALFYVHSILGAFSALALYVVLVKLFNKEHF